MRELLKAGVAVGAMMAASAGMCDALKARGHYVVECHDKDGELRWRDEVHNLVTTIGKNYLLDNALAGSGYTAAFYLGLVDGASAPTYAAADTSASHAGWSENTGYSNANRPAVGFNAATAGSKTSTTTAFNINGNSTIAGVFLSTLTTKAGTTGTLITAGSFTGGNRLVQNGDVLNVTWALSI